MTDTIMPHPDGGSVLQMGVTAQQRLTAMIANWQARGDVLDAEAYVAEHHKHDLDESRKLAQQRKELDRSVINALCSMIRLGGLAMADNQDPPSLIVHTDHLTYGVSVLRQIGMQWSVDS